MVSDIEAKDRDEVFARGGDDFNDKYKAPIEVEEEEEEEEMLGVEEEVEDDGENRVTRSCRAKKTGERHVYGCKTSVPASFLSKFKKNFSLNDIV